jgi:acyl CoA:acetate/3-ketoacid CoA transferase alpha subunit
MAGAATVTIAEVEQTVEAGEIDPERVNIPGIFVDRVVKMPKLVRWLDGHEVPGYLTPKV